jgi:NAD+ synthase
MDLIWYGLKNEIPAEVVAKEMDLETEQVERVYADLIQKKRTTDYLRMPPVGISD